MVSIAIPFARHFSCDREGSAFWVSHDFSRSNYVGRKEKLTLDVYRKKCLKR